MVRGIYTYYAISLTLVIVIIIIALQIYYIYIIRYYLINKRSYIIHIVKMGDVMKEI